MCPFSVQQLLKQDENPGIEFEYSLQAGSVKDTPEGGEHYDWLAGEWSECSGGCSFNQVRALVVLVVLGLYCKSFAGRVLL